MDARLVVQECMDTCLTVQGRRDAQLTGHEHMDKKVSQRTSLCDWRLQNSTVVGIIENQKGKTSNNTKVHMSVSFWGIPY